MSYTLELTGLDQPVILDVQGTSPQYLVVSKQGKQIRLSASAYQLLHLVQSGHSFTELAVRFSRTRNNALAAAEIEAAYQKVITQIEGIDQQSSDQFVSFWLRIPLFSQVVVNYLARYFAMVYRPGVAICCLCLIVITQVLLLPYSRLLWNDAPAIWAGAGLLLLASILHEFGHASASLYFGARPSEIGFGIYLLYPVLYSNVNNAWSLTRWQRVVVDCGGLYFELIFAALCATVYLLYGWPTFGLGAIFVTYQALYTLNPVLKYDGYWMIADALGITDLNQQPRYLLRYLVGRMRGKKSTSSLMTRPLAIAMVVYTLFVAGFWIYFVLVIVPHLWQVLVGYPAQIQAMLEHFATLPYLPAPMTLSTFVSSTLLVVIFSVMGIRLLISLGRLVRA